MKSLVAIVVLAWIPVVTFSAEPASDRPVSDGAGWISLFDGKTLDGWRVGGDPKSFSVEDGKLVAQAVGGNAHLFYNGDVAGHDFKNFQLKMDVMTTEGSNSGIYIHTGFQESGWPRQGYEIQVNVSHGDPKKSGGLYGIQDCLDPPAKDNVWYTQEITVQGKRIISKIDGHLIFDYTEPDDWKEKGRRLSSGTFAIQAHDPKSRVYFKNILVKPLGD